MSSITWSDFERVDIRAGTILEVLDFPKAKKPAYKIKVDFGSFGIKWTSAQVTKHYLKEQLINRQVLGVINLPPKQVADFMSEFLLTGLANEHGDIILAAVDKPVPNGSKLI